jgi:hypothetical protein
MKEKNGLEVLLGARHRYSQPEVLRKAAPVTERSFPESAPPVRREKLKAPRPLIRFLVINDNHYGLTFLFEL